MSFLKDKLSFLISIGFIVVIYFIYKKLIDFKHILNSTHDKMETMKQTMDTMQIKIDILQSNTSKSEIKNDNNILDHIAIYSNDLSISIDNVLEKNELNVPEKNELNVLETVPEVGDDVECKIIDPIVLEPDLDNVIDNTPVLDNVIDNVIVPVLDNVPVIDNVIVPVIDNVPVLDNVIVIEPDNVPVLEPDNVPVIDNVPAPVLDNVIVPVIDNVPVLEPDNVPAPVLDNVITPVLDNVITPVLDNVPAPVLDNVIASVLDTVPIELFDKDVLSKSNLSNIKKIATKNNITLSKKINGVQKQKTKQELIDNLLVKN